MKSKSKKPNRRRVNEILYRQGGTSIDRWLLHLTMNTRPKSVISKNKRSR